MFVINLFKSSFTFFISSFISLKKTTSWMLFGLTSHQLVLELITIPHSEGGWVSCFLMAETVWLLWKCKVWRGSLELQRQKKEVVEVHKVPFLSMCRTTATLSSQTTTWVLWIFQLYFISSFINHVRWSITSLWSVFQLWPPVQIANFYFIPLHHRWVLLSLQSWQLPVQLGGSFSWLSVSL